MDKNIGKKLDGRYEITELIGVEKGICGKRRIFKTFQK